MAKLSELVALTAEVLGESEGRVRLAARHLREAGLIRSGGRGGGGADMEPSDAVNLLIVLCGAADLTSGATWVRRWRRLVLNRGRTSIHAHCPSMFQYLGTPGLRLGNALDEFVALAGLRTFVEAFEPFVPETHRSKAFDFIEGYFRVGTWGAWVTFGRPTLWGKIRIGDAPESNSPAFAETNFWPSWTRNLEAEVKEYSQHHGDRRDETRISTRSLVPIARLLAAGAPNAMPLWN